MADVMVDEEQAIEIVSKNLSPQKQEHLLARLLS